MKLPQATSDWLLKDFKSEMQRDNHLRILPAIEKTARTQQLLRDKFRDTDHVHPSDLAKNHWCPRATYFKITREPESNPAPQSMQRLNIFRTGNDVHHKFQNWMWEAGGLSGMWWCKDCQELFMALAPTECPRCESPNLEYNEVPIRDEEFNILGHADGVWEDDQGKAVVEIKSVGPGTIRWDAPQLFERYTSGEVDLDGLWKAIKRPLIPHRRQINLYMNTLRIWRGIVIYEWKPTQEVREFHVSYDESLVKPMLAGARVVQESLQKGLAPERPVSYRKSIECKFCPFKDRCYQ